MAISTEQLRKLIEDKKVTIGTDETKRALTSGGLKKVLIASNASEPTKAALARFQAIGGVDVEELPVPNDELGTMCKKPFSISVLGIKK